MQTSDIHLIQVTDLHLQNTADTLFRGINVELRWHRVIDDICQKGAVADLLMLTGDLVHHSGIPAYERVYDSIKRLPFSSVWIPGNHDDVAQMRQVGHPSLNRKRVDIGDWCILLLDSTSEPDGKGAGELAESELLFLQQQLQKSQNQHVLIVLHHNPVSVQSRWQDEIALRNADAFWTQVSRSDRVRAVVFGHVHQQWSLTHQGVPLFSAPAVAPQFKARSETMALEDNETLSGPGYVSYRLSALGEVSVDKVVRLPNIVD